MHLFGSKSPEYFKDLKTALFSMHQVVTGDSWASGIVRSLFDANEEGVVMTDANIALFFVSYFIISNVLLLNGTSLSHSLSLTQTQTHAHSHSLTLTQPRPLNPLLHPTPRTHISRHRRFARRVYRERAA